MQGTLLAVGHSNGDVTLWQLQRTSWEPARFIRSARPTAPSSCLRLPSRLAPCHRVSLGCRASVSAQICAIDLSMQQLAVLTILEEKDKA